MLPGKQIEMSSNQQRRVFCCCLNDVAELLLRSVYINVGLNQMATKSLKLVRQTFKQS